MKTLLIAILLLAITMNLSAKRTDPYQHARDMRINSLNQQNVKNYSKVLSFAQRGDAVAQFDLAIMYATGNGVRKSEKEAFNWFHKAALNNHTEAKYYMGLSFLKGRGVKRQPHLARQWFKRAAKAGHPKAVFHLAKIEKALFGTLRTANNYSMNY